MEGRGRPLLADSAYGSEANASLLRRLGFLPLLRPRKGARRGLGVRIRMREFERNRGLYRRRGIAEALFVGWPTGTAPARDPGESGPRS